MKAPLVIIGKEFTSTLTGTGYGIFRECGGGFPEAFSAAKFGAPFAEDSGGNLFTTDGGGRVCFWDHETDELTVIASSMEEFVVGCVSPAEVMLKHGQVKSAWMDPVFAKKMGIPFPADGWIKKKA